MKLQTDAASLVLEQNVLKYNFISVHVYLLVFEDDSFLDGNLKLDFKYRLTNYMAYGTRRFNASFTKSLEEFLS